MIYRYLFIIYILLFIRICIIYSKNITIYGILHSFFDNDFSYHRIITNAFNEYSRENGLGINLQLKVITPETSTIERESYGTTIDSFLLKKSETYDIYFYYSSYGQAYGNHFINLKDYLTNEYIEKFDEKILKEGCSSSDNKLIALPVLIDITALFSNQELLSKYNMDVPKTWDELMSTSKFIYEEEKKKNSTIIRYHSSMNDINGGTAIYEFINSYRESNSSPHPEITSKTTYEALEKLKEMKDELGEVIFRNPEDAVYINIGYGIGDDVYLFVRYFYVAHDPLFKATALPGRKKGVSGSYVKSTNISISKYINDTRREAALEFFKFVAQKETQKNYIINNYFYSAMTELYDDEDVCSKIECDIIKDAYPFSMKNNNVNLFGDDLYNTKYRNNMFDYLYKNIPLDEVLKKIDDITKIYTFSLKTDGMNIGFIIIIIFSFFIIWMTLSLIFIFIKELEKRFQFLSKDLWVLTTLGSYILMSSLLTLYGDVTNVKCHLKIILINMGFILSICPSLHKLITNFPARNNISLWFQKNKYISILIVVIFTGSLNGILALPSYDLQVLKTSDGLNYKKCNMNNIFGGIIYYIIQIYNILIILISLLLIYMEWSLEETSLDVNFLSTALFMDILSIILFNIIDKIKFKNYIIYNALLAINILMFSVSNHLFIYFIRILPIFGSNVCEESKIIKELLNSDLHDSKKFSNLSSSVNNSSIKRSEYDGSNKTTSSNNSKLKKFSQIISSFHNQKTISQN